MAERRPALLVFADDWGRHPSSCQHLTRHLLLDHEVYWVNTIGTRTPRLDWDTLRRGWEKLRHWSRSGAPANALPTGLHVLNPKMWPWFGSSFHRGLNRRLLVRQLSPVLSTVNAPVTGITTIPLVADLIGVLPVERWVYYCVDDFSEWPGLDGSALRQMEEDLVRKVDSVVVVSETLRQKLARMGREAYLLTHGVDIDFWTGSVDDEAFTVLDGLERPFVVFWGVIDRRMDVAFVRRLTEELTARTIVLAGPEADPDPALLSIPRVVRLGPLPFERLPRLAREAAVLIMPYADLPVTRAMQPLKMKEYLATGRPVVVRDLPATREWADCLDAAATPDEFARLVCLRIEQGVPAEQQQARSRLAEESWAEKARSFARFAWAEQAQPQSV